MAWDSWTAETQEWSSCPRSLAARTSVPTAEVEQELPRLWKQGLRPTNHRSLTWPLGPILGEGGV